MCIFCFSSQYNIFLIFCHNNEWVDDCCLNCEACYIWFYIEYTIGLHTAVININIVAIVTNSNIWVVWWNCYIFHIVTNFYVRTKVTNDDVCAIFTNCDIIDVASDFWLREKYNIITKISVYITVVKIEIRFNISIKVEVNIIVMYNILLVQFLFVFFIMLLNCEVLIFYFCTIKHCIKALYSTLQLCDMIL